MVHLNIHTDNKPFNCPQCNRGFAYKQKLDTHLKYHNDIRDHKCDHCDMAFHESKTLKVYCNDYHYLAWWELYQLCYIAGHWINLFLVAELTEGKWYVLCPIMDRQSPVIWLSVAKYPHACIIPFGRITLTGSTGRRDPLFLPCLTSSSCWPTLHRLPQPAHPSFRSAKSLSRWVHWGPSRMRILSRCIISSELKLLGMLAVLRAPGVYLTLTFPLALNLRMSYLSRQETGSFPFLLSSFHLKLMIPQKKNQNIR